MIYPRTTGVLTAAVSLCLVGLGLVMLTGCSAESDAATSAVRTYVEAVAAGDGKAAHEADPYSPILTTEGLAASTAGGHIEIVSVGSFTEAEEKLKVEVPETETTPTADPSTGTTHTDWTGIDWEDTSWTGSDADDDDSLKDAKEVKEGIVPVTYKLAGEEHTVPIGIAYGSDTEGNTVTAFRAVALTDELAAQYGIATAPPALAPAAVSLSTTDSDNSSEETSESWWEKVKDKADDDESDTPEVTRAGTISGATVTLSDQTPLLLLPGTYDVAIGDAPADVLWAAPGSPEPAAVTLGPGDQYTAALGEAVVTEAGTKLVQDKMAELAETKFDAMTTFTTSDRDKSCGVLAPSSGWGSSSSTSFEDEWFTTATTNIASGGISVTGTSSNKAKATVEGNGSSSTLADEAFCSGKASADAKTYTVPVNVTDSSLTPGTTVVAADGTITTTTPWTLAMTTTVTTWDDTDASGTSVGWGKDPVKSTYVATVSITWSPTGTLTADGEIKAAA